MNLNQLSAHGIPLLSESTLENLIYVVGPARGGTSILAKAIGQHPEIMGIWDDYHFVDQIWPYRNKVHDRLWRILVLLPKFCDLDLLSGQLEPNQHRILVKYVNEVIKQKQYKSLFCLFPFLYALGLSKEKNINSFRSWLVKDNTWRDLKPISQKFPKSRFVFIIRDPRGSILSIAKRASGNSSGNLTLGSLIEGALYWVTLTEKCLSFAKQHPARAHFIYFEKFLLQPENTLNEAFEFIAGQKLPALDMERLLNELDGGATNDPKEVYSGVSKAPLARWEQELSKEGLELIAEIAGKTAKKVGYCLGPPDKSRGPIGLSRHVSGRRRKIIAAIKIGFLKLTQRPLAR